MVFLVTSVHAEAAQTTHTCGMFKLQNDETKTTDFDPTKTQERFEQIVTRVTDMHKENISALGGELHIENEWESDEINAFAMKNSKIWYLSFSGGLYKHKLTTDDAFALTVCHELGHLLGGAPFNPGSEVSVEGQADFWATSVCLKKYFKEYPETVPMTPGVSKIKCDSRFPNDLDAQNICYRTANASLSVAKVLSVMAKVAPPELEKQDTNSRANTRPYHPEVQCRLDTYVAGSLCEIEDTSLKFEEKLFTDKLTTDFKCSEAVDGVMSLLEKRPKCWFNELNYGYSTSFIDRVKSKSLTGLKGGTITLAYYNHLPGTYKIRLVPDVESARFVKVESPDYVTTLPASGSTYDFDIKFKFIKRANRKINFKVEIEYDGKIIMHKDNIITIEAFSKVPF